MKIIKMKKETFSIISELLAYKGMESGGIIGSIDDIIMKFHFDRLGNRSEYIPNVTKLNFIINNIWRHNGISFCGFVHSHPNGLKLLSYYDKEYAKTILVSCTNLKKIYIGIVEYDDTKPILHMNEIMLENRERLIILPVKVKYI